jgi:hypothetical protein
MCQRVILNLHPRCVRCQAAIDRFPPLTPAPARPPAIVTRLLTRRFSSAVSSLAVLFHTAHLSDAPSSRSLLWLLPPRPSFPLNLCHQTLSSGLLQRCHAAPHGLTLHPPSLPARPEAEPLRLPAPAFRLPPSAPASNPAAALPFVQNSLPDRSL